MKEFIKNNKLGIILIFTGIILIIFGCMFNDNSHESSDRIEEDYTLITYKITKHDYCSCISFDNNNNFYEYDCDSEPTSMPFTGEYYNTYSYNKKDSSITFMGKGMKKVKAEVISWDSNKLVLKVLGSKQNERCSSNYKDTYEYYADQLQTNGKKVKEILSKIDKEDLIIEYWGKDGKQTCTIKYEERCNNTARIITKEEIISQLEDNHDFRFSYFRDNKCNITSILISWVRT